jgi:gentisate 1,2-dioxygenase
VNKDHTGNKYHRRIKSVEDIAGFTTADVYSVLDAFEVQCPARQHAIKKLLCSGIRGKGDTMQDLIEARDAVERAIVLERQRKGGEL